MSAMKQLDDVPEKNHPLHLLDLPLDILKDIVKQVSLMSDRTRLLIFCSESRLCPRSSIRMI